ncbi:hypothetical protein ES705_25648 [subsurface metagenome]
MPIIRVPKNSNNPFFMMDNNTINNTKLSLQATAILTYLISKPDNWVVRITDIVSHFSNGYTSVRSAFKELVSAGYIVHKPVRSKNGKMLYYDYIVYENPFKSNPNINNLHIANPKPLHDFKQVVNRRLTNTKKESNTDPKTTKYYNKSNPLSVVQDDPSLKPIKHETVLLLYEFGIRNYKKLFDLFPIGDIFDYVDWMIPFKSKIRNKFGFLITALRERWSDPEAFRKARMP